jgi:hypothetical protein
VSAETFECGVETRPMRYVDPEPAEYCETEVENEGDLCSKHDDDQEPDWDNVREDREELERERETSGYYEDHGDGY